MQWIAPSEKDPSATTLEKRLWAAADQFRANSGLTAAQYSQPVLGLIFLRFAEVKFANTALCLETISAEIRQKQNPNKADLSSVMGDITNVLDQSIAGVAMPAKPAAIIDLSKINFDALRERFKESKHKNTDLEILKAAIRAQLDKMIRVNKTRTNFREKFEELIDSYNNGSRNLDDLLAEITKFTHTMTDEQQRNVREQMSDEDLVVFDILTRPAPELNTDERTEVKKVAKQLLAKLKQECFVLDWRKREAARARVEQTIGDLLDDGLPRAYSTDDYKQKCSAVFAHVYETYPGGEGKTYSAGV